MDDSSTLIDRMISGLLPGFLIIGALVALVGEFHLPFWLALVLIAGTVASTIAYVLRIHGWELSFPLAHWKDLRWVVVPAVVAYTSWLDPTWSSPMMWDQADHLQTANRYLGRWDWEPFHQGIDHSFRPKVISGLLAIELAWNGARAESWWVPMMLILACGWQVQLLGERLSNKGMGWLAPLFVLSMPEMMTFGRTAYLDALATGGLALVLLLFLSSGDRWNKKQLTRLGVISGLVAVAKYPYLYLGPVAGVIIFIQHRRIPTQLIVGWLMIILPFALADLIFHGSATSSLSSQIDGTVSSITGDWGGYTPRLAWEDILSQIHPALVALFLSGTLFGFVFDRHRTMMALGMLVPAIILFVFILDFGYPRYHLPWIAGLLSVAIGGWERALNRVISNLQPKRSLPRIGRTIVIILITASLILVPIWAQLGAILSESLDLQERRENGVDYRWRRVDAMEEFTPFFDEEDIIVTSYDISMGVRWGVASYRFGTSEDPLYDSVQMLDASHVTLLASGRYDFEREPIVALGAPLIPVHLAGAGSLRATLWEVDSARMTLHPQAHSVDLEWASARYGDAALVPPGTEFILPENLTLHEVIDLGSDSTGRTAVDLRFGLESSAEVLCTGAACQEIPQSVPEGVTYLVRFGPTDAG